MPIMFGSGAELKEIEVLENSFSIILPHDYISFLRDYNGFYINGSDGCDIDFEYVDNGFISFESFFGIDFVNENFSLSNVNNYYLDEVSFIKNSLIIGSDPGGNFYTLVNESKMAGVYYWDRTHLHADDVLKKYTIAEVNECGDLYKVSDSFDDFFKTIQKLTEGFLSS